ncbi:DUF433 domain-containing protein [Wenzhouxiangella limi]|uniref:DUF433 domain-containing protein n=1 Tax=Wenzhouxiangella limi TaxID=2707351 RepID=A0A845UZ03_9GAMM|nr:DUF433 domain-containing protein [Wenzhouxiangella limi]NDY95512.1 DUF433 domain-containing protein [Wenzhouxiangella limi]
MQGAQNRLVGVGLYSVPEASLLSGVASAAVRRWLFGYQSRSEGKIVSHPGLWNGQIAATDERGVGFLDLLELRLVAAFRAHGVSLQAIRAASDFARRAFGRSHPFTFKQFQTDGRSIFAEVVERGDAEGDPAMLDLVKRQFVFRRVIQPSLKGVVYGETGQAEAWRPGESRFVILDPQRAFGKPIDNRSGVPTEVIYAAVKAEGDPKFVARLYEMDVRAVKAAVAFQKALEAGETVH